MRKTSILLIPALMALAACAPVDINVKTPLPVDNDQPVSELDPLMEGPTNDEIPPYDGGNAALPVKYDALVSFNSPVKSQGHRGVCSIFSTTALMEHLYILEGTIPNPDFSEQFLQWSAKFEVGSFPNSSGSNANYNLRAIHDYGIVAEEDWPYEPYQWNTSDDAACDGGDNQPTRCYTNGQPPAEALSAQRYDLPSGHYLSTYDIKNFLANEEMGLVVGLEFFYQAWNHRLSDLPTNSDYWNAGYVTYPNQEDKDFSRQEDMRAGHSILILGWDDDIQVPMRDGDGEIIHDADGNVVYEKGFYIFKNSWGTSGFGINNIYGPGYGYISQRYVRDFGRARYSGLPTNVPVPGGDRTVRAEGQGGLSIPDNDASGITSVATVTESGIVRSVKVDVDITHTWKGDLRVTLTRAGETVVLHDRAGGSADDLKTTYDVTDFNGLDMTGDWTLNVSDNEGLDVGTLNAWAVEITTDAE